ncbi:MAG: 4Fe-4S dicluster domain-containing protein [Candidatus Helarchaeota archaeon]
MIDDVYEKVRQKLVIGAIRTPEHEKVIELMKVFWNEDEIALLSHFPKSGKLISVKELTEKSGIPKTQVRTLLKGVAKRHTIAKLGSKYSLVPLLPGVFEGYFIARQDSEDKLQQAALLYRFLIKNIPSLTTFNEEITNKLSGTPITSPLLPYDAQERLITVDESVAVEPRVVSMELVKAMIDKNDTFAALTCPCRLVGEMSGEPCEVAPAELGCFVAGAPAALIIEAGFGRALTKTEAIEFIRQTEEAGLVHNTMGTAGDEVYSICNCCNCHCGALHPTHQTQFALKFISPSNFTPKHNTDQCILCEKCVDICPMDAITHPSGEDTLVFNPSLCIGCGICAANCPETAIQMVKVRENTPNSFESMPKEAGEVSFKTLFQAIIAGP